MKIIGESAFNHNGNVQYLLDLALQSKMAGADFFTVQVYDLKSFCVPDYSKFEICKKVELGFEQWTSFFKYAKENEIEIIPCTLDEKSFDFCLKLGFDLIKIHATDLLNKPLLYKIAKSDCKIILETQCATKRDIKIAVDILKDKIEAIFHGFSDYPTEFKNLNINALNDIKNSWPQFKTGFADHTLDTLGIPVMILAKGIDYLEKHITLDRSTRNYDWQVSLEPYEFRIMVQNIKKYEESLGKSFKHPEKSELKYRDIMYKKYLTNGTVIRSDNGMDYYENLSRTYKKDKIIATIIARLKSKRLSKKIFLPFNSDFLVFDLISRVSCSKKINKVILATSFLDEDREIIDESVKRGVEVYPGDPDSVIDRMLDLAENEKAGAVFRITGDNPFTDPFLIDQMINLYIDHDLEYVRANNLPFGVTAELFSINYLYRLYYELENPYQTEYLTWFVMQDNKSVKGCIDFNFPNPDLKRVGYSVDYPEDYQKCINLLKAIGKSDIKNITLKDIIDNTQFDNLIDLKTKLKLPENQSISYKEYFNRLDNMNYKVRKKLNYNAL